MTKTTKKVIETRCAICFKGTIAVDGGVSPVVVRECQICTSPRIRASIDRLQQTRPQAFDLSRRQTTSP